MVYDNIYFSILDNKTNGRENMKCIYVGHDDVLLTDYNGKRYAFPKKKPVEVPTEVYNHMIRSGNVEAEYLKVYEEPVGVKPNIPDTPKPKEEPKKKKSKK